MSQPDPSPSTLTETPFALVTRWKSEGLPRAQWVERLISGGLDAESARVVVNSVDGANPSELPEAAFSQATNALAPGAFAFTDLGLRGHPATTGLYWLAFGASSLVLLAVFALLLFTGAIDRPGPALSVSAKVMGTIGVLALVRGVWQLLGAITIRRRTP